MGRVVWFLLLEFQCERPRSDGFSYWCPQCKTREYLFKKSRVSLQKWLLLIHLWARNYPLTDAADEAKIDAGTAVDIFQWFHEVCTTKLLQAPIVLGGEGIVVHIDESLFRHKSKVIIVTQWITKKLTTFTYQTSNNYGYIVLLG